MVRKCLDIRGTVRIIAATLALCTGAGYGGRYGRGRLSSIDHERSRDEAARTSSLAVHADGLAYAHCH
jgi:hypothetical protein